jgi:hypothetical protein
MDNMKRFWTPQEDEFGPSVLSLQSPVRLGFPGRRVYDKYLIYAALLTPSVRGETLYANAKLAYKYNRPLVLKSPSYCPCSMAAEMFPDAKLRIHRNPFPFSVNEGCFSQHRHR